MVHPVVRSNQDDVRQLVEFFNAQLRADGWVLVATTHMSGRPVFAAQRTKGAKQPATALRLPEYQRLREPRVFEEHLRRIEAGIKADPAAAIASSKELVESVCKIILDDYQVTYSGKEDLPDLYKKAATELKLTAESVPGSAKGSQAAQGHCARSRPLFSAWLSCAMSSVWGTDERRRARRSRVMLASRLTPRLRSRSSCLIRGTSECANRGSMLRVRVSSPTQISNKVEDLWLNV
jgi:hypothetical protein